MGKKAVIAFACIVTAAVVVFGLYARYKVEQRGVIVSQEVVRAKGEHTDTASQDLVSQELKEEGRNFQLRLVAEVHAEPRRVYDTLVDFDNLKSLIPDCTHLEVVESQGNKRIVYMKRFILFMGKEMGGNLEYTLHPEELKFEMKVMRDPNANLVEQWSVESMGDKARVTYVADVQPKLKVPIFMAQAWIKDNFVDVMKAVRRKLEHGPNSG